MWPFNKLGSPSLKDESDDMTDSQIQSFFESLESRPTSSSPSTSSSPNTSPISSTTQNDTKNANIAEQHEKKEDPCNLQYYFDEAFMCFTPKSQARNWYRYGELKDCSERWRDFKWCMKTRMGDEETVQGMLKLRREELVEEVRAGPNSEDVWEYREEPVRNPWSGAEGGEETVIS